MIKLARFLILTSLLISALACYVFGSTSGAIAFFVLGACLELAFWFGLAKGLTSAVGSK